MRKFYYGTIANGSEELIMDRENIPSPHKIILGRPRSGKSVAVYSEIEQIEENTDDDILLFAKGSDSDRTKSLGLSTIVVNSKESESYINPLDVVLDYRRKYDDRCFLASNHVYGVIFSIYETIKDDGNELTLTEKDLLAKAAEEVFASFFDYLIENNLTHDFAKNPTFSDVICAVSKSKCYRKDAEAIVSNVEPYSNFPELISVHTNIDCKRAAIVNKGSYALKDFSYISFLSFAFNRAQLNSKNGKTTWVYVDNSRPLLERNTAPLIFELIRKSRVLNVVATLVFTYTDDLRSDYFNALLSNCGIVQAFSIPAFDAGIIKRYFHLSDGDIAYATDAGVGNCLVIVGDTAVNTTARVRYDTSCVRYFSNYSKLMSRI